MTSPPPPLEAEVTMILDPTIKISEFVVHPGEKPLPIRVCMMEEADYLQSLPAAKRLAKGPGSPTPVGALLTASGDSKSPGEALERIKESPVHTPACDDSSLVANIVPPARSPPALCEGKENIAPPSSTNTTQVPSSPKRRRTMTPPPVSPVKPSNATQVPSSPKRRRTVTPPLSPMKLLSVTASASPRSGTPGRSSSPVASTSATAGGASPPVRRRHTRHSMMVILGLESQVPRDVGMDLDDAGGDNDNNAVGSDNNAVGSDNAAGSDDAEGDNVESDDTGDLDSDESPFI
ncbi:hypothetical protein OF83DRAFT_1121523 [Amylostereum chailletii]|nr:hypothetical protein OF83DRAFT_1121523 [Amylostereum chailletii]